MIIRRFVLAAALLLAGFAASSTGAIIKTGDVLEISVLQHAEFSGTYTVSQRGTIDHPLLADESVNNISTGELMRDLTLRLAKYVDNPLVTVRVVENPEITVTMLGEVQKPGPTRTYAGVSVQEAVALGGGPTKSADLTRVKIVRLDQPDRDAEFFDLQAFMVQGRFDAMPKLRDGDKVILLSKQKSTKVKVIGGVNRPGFYELEEEMNVFEIVYLAGGPAEKADLSRVRRLSKDDGKTSEEIIDLQRYIDKGDVDGIPMVKEGDIIIVYSKLFDWKSLLTILNSTLLFIVTIQAFSGVFK